MTINDIHEIVLDKSVAFDWKIIFCNSIGTPIATVKVYENEAEDKYKEFVAKWLNNIKDE